MTAVDRAHDGASQASEPDVDELRKESYTMGLYVSVCLLAALTAYGGSSSHDGIEVFGLVWGTTVGLALAHWFAFRVSARLVGAGTLDRRDVAISLAQVGGAVVVALLCSIAILVLPASSELDAVRLVLGGMIAFAAFLTSRSGGSSRFRAAVYATSVLVVGLTVAVVKNVLAGH